MKKKLLLVLILLILLVYILNAFLRPIPYRKALNYQPVYGTSFSFEQAGWYGLSPRQSFEEMLNNYKFDWIRVPYFWSGEAGLDDLKYAAETAQKHHVKIVVSLGAKTPYYPEYHLPPDLSSKLKFGQVITLQSAIAENILAEDKKVVEELSAYESISYWQVENEPFLGNVNGWKIGKDLLSAEVSQVRLADPKHRSIILNSYGPPTWDKSYLPLFDLLKPGDIFAVNAYLKSQGTYIVHKKFFGKEITIDWPRKFSWPVQSWLFFSPNYSGLKKETAAKGLGFWILEMQAEPYIRPDDDKNSRDFAFKAGDIVRGDDYLKSAGVDSIGLWGIHFWQYRDKNGDSSWAEAIKNLVNH